jgi:hypothetical protein
VIDLYTWTTPNGRKVSIALEELGLPCLVLRASQAKVLLSARVKPNRFDPLYEVGNRSTAFITIVPFLKGNDQARAVTSGLCAPVRSAEGKLVRRGVVSFFPHLNAIR